MSCVETHLWGAVREMDLNREERRRDVLAAMQERKLKICSQALAKILRPHENMGPPEFPKLKFRETLWSKKQRMNVSPFV